MDCLPTYDTRYKYAPPLPRVFKLTYHTWAARHVCYCAAVAHLCSALSSVLFYCSYSQY